MTENEKTDDYLGGPLSMAVRECYRAGEDDEALEPLVLTDERVSRSVASTTGTT